MTVSAAFGPAEIEPWVRRLFLPTYTVSEAARYARVHPQTVTRWYYGSKVMLPVLANRERRTPLSYLQLIEVAFVASFRQAGVTMQRIRKARQYFAETFHSDYPFAQYRLMTEGTHLLLDLKGVGRGGSAREVIVTNADGQLAWANQIGARFAEFDYERGLALRWHPAGRESPVVIDPRISFGAPMIRGIPTSILRGRWRAGESVAGIRANYGLEEDEIQAALQFEGIKDAA